MDWMTKHEGLAMALVAGQQRRAGFPCGKLLERDVESDNPATKSVYLLGPYSALADPDVTNQGYG